MCFSVICVFILSTTSIKLLDPVQFMSNLKRAGDDLESGLSGVGHKEPGADYQPPQGCGPLHVVQHRRKPLRHILQGQDHPTHGVSLRKPPAGSAIVKSVSILRLRKKKVFTT